MGAFAEGMVVAEAAVLRAEAVEQPYSLVVALMGVGTLYLRQGDLSHATPVLQQSLVLLDKLVSYSFMFFVRKVWCRSI
jgi:hypothetical protein